MIDLIILYILNKYDSTIYRISKIADEFFFALIKTSIGTISPAMKRLEKNACVNYVEKMTDGGLLSKNFSITQIGRKYLVDLLLNFDSKNPYHIVNEAKIAIYCSDILDKEDYLKFKENIKNCLELHKIKLEHGLNNSYIELNQVQKAVVKNILAEIDELIKIL